MSRIEPGCLAVICGPQRDKESNIGRVVEVVRFIGYRDAGTDVLVIYPKGRRPMVQQAGESGPQWLVKSQMGLVMHGVNAPSITVPECAVPEHRLRRIDDPGPASGEDTDITIDTEIPATL